MLELKSISKTFNPGTVNENALCTICRSACRTEILSPSSARTAPESPRCSGDRREAFLTDSGEILLDGQNVTFWPEHRRSKSSAVCFRIRCAAARRA